MAQKNLTATQVNSTNGNSQETEIILNEEQLWAVLSQFKRFQFAQPTNGKMTLDTLFEHTVSRARGISKTLFWGLIYCDDSCVLGEDLAMSFWVLADYFDDLEAIEELRRLLKRDGKITCKFDDYGNCV